MRKKTVFATVAFLIVLGFVFSITKPKKDFPSVETKTQVVKINNQEPFPPQFPEKALFLSPILQQKGEMSLKTVTGITVPHHLLASDLIAKAFRFASKGKYEQILLVSPDHFNLGKKNISVAERDFSTVFGSVPTDRAAVSKLKENKYISAENFFYREHGVGAELPFISYYFPNTKIIVLTFKEATPKVELDEVVGLLKNILQKNTLVVQSTDFSHYLTLQNAEKRDEQTLKVLKSGEVEKLFELSQPSNLDSIASQYVQSRLQKEFFSSNLTILEHKNSQNYTKETVDSTTSYIVQAYVSQ